MFDCSLAELIAKVERHKALLRDNVLWAQTPAETDVRASVYTKIHSDFRLVSRPGGKWVVQRWVGPNVKSKTFDPWQDVGRGQDFLSAYRRLETEARGQANAQGH